ncbi:MAG: hypothetical protein PWQ67_1707 [Clostridia bacterium]|jgi:ribosomal protein L7Ae-like RNA K-turn-binding protein|nr:hypothetical protein [Clostridia bacterium]MDN5323253.1 hypothetical protein [Clostridia bacterium]
MKNKLHVFTMLGFAQKAGKIVSGESAVKAMLNKGQIHLIIMAEDLSENRKKFWSYLALQSRIPVSIIGTKQELGIAIGLSPRAIIGITDLQMAKSIELKM